MLSPLSPTAYGGIGVITPMAGVAILIMAGEVIRLITAMEAGVLAGVASTADGVGDGDITIIITIPAVAGIPVAVDTGEVGTGEVAAYIQTDVTPVHVAQHLLCVHPVQIECPVRQET